MEKEALKQLLESVRSGKLPVSSALRELSDLPFHDLGFAKIDHHRAVRTGYPEVILCQNKSVDHILGIVRLQMDHGETVFGTRASPEVLDAIERRVEGITMNRVGRCFWKKSRQWRKKRAARGAIVIASAGTADAAVVEEARCTVEILGHPCRAIQDIGVAGIHRLLAHRRELQTASVIVAVAGMEGALPSVIAGLVSCPVIGVPTSVGYGSHLDGLVPLFAMLNSCSSGLTVVNIDNGYGAACAAVAMNGG